jgi:hypothetical protein
MDMRMKVDEIPEGLNPGDHSRKALFVIDLLKKNLTHCLPSSVNEATQKSSIVPKIDAKPFGNGEHKLSMRNLGKNIFPQVMRQKQSAFLMARGATTPLATGKRNEHLVSALFALYPGKSLLKISTLHELVDRAADYGSPETVLLFITIGISSLKLVKIAINKAEKWRELRVSVAIKPDRNCSVSNHDDSGKSRQ